MNLRVFAAVLCVLLHAAGEPGKIMRPVDKASFASGAIDVIATAPEGILEIDGVRLKPEQPFPNVLHVKAQVKPGVHTLKLSWPGGQQEIQFYAGDNAPAGFTPFRPHPPAAGAPCTQCHQLSRRGRFVFKGGCFDCHNNTGFAKTHTHTPETLSECGLCHNAHGSTAIRHLTLTKELACKQCHN